MTNTCDSNRALLQIAGIPVALEIPDEEKLSAVRDRYADFIVSETCAKVSIRVQVTPGAQFIPMTPGPFVVETTFEDGRIHYRSYFDSGWFDLNNSEGALEIAPHTDVENFLRVLYAYLCLREGGLLLHAAGVVRDGKGHVFFGPSGSGKTTVTLLSEDTRVLSDDLVILRLVDEKVRVFGVPFRGELPEAPRANVSADLKGLFSLVKASENRVANLEKAEAIGRLVACAPFVMRMPGCARRVIEISSQIASRINVRALHFKRDSGFWKVIDEY